ncbi:MAG: ComEC/Rec2 family competence protein, partial [Clostridia bacterium]|nr:ComEC/Rec2 family competence protein [Clostridia bacterium]
MKKINFRTIFYGLISFCFALIFAKQIFSLSVFHIIFAVGVCGTVLYLCIKYNCIKRFVFLGLIFVIGIGYYFLGYYSFALQEYSGKVLLQGRASVVTMHTGYSSIILEDIKIDGKNKSFNIQASYSGTLDFGQGDIIIFETTLTKVKLFENGGFNSYYYKNNTPYKTTIKHNDYIVKDGYISFDESIRNKFNNFVEENFSQDVAPIVSSVIIGDKTALDKDIKTAFGSSGLGHLLVISGLHIGFIVLLINFILDKVKANKKVSFIVLFLLLMFYCYICNFSPSVTRACLMSIVFMLAQLVYHRYDKLNCLSLCAWIILFAKPLYIFDAGFLLSFVSVFCIFTLTKPIKNLFKKFKFKKLASPLAVIFSVQLGLIPIMSLYYNNFNLFSFL